MTAWDEGVTWYDDLVTAPTERAVTLAYVRDQHLRGVNEAFEDPFLERAIDAATNQAEHYMRRAVRDQTRALVLSGFPISGRIVIPMPPLISVTSVTYIDEDGASQTLATSEYDVVIKAGPNARRSTVDRAYNVTWPGTRPEIQEAVTVTYRAGYIDTSVSPEVENVPSDIQHGIAMRAAEYYKQRSDSVLGVGVAVTPAIIQSRHLWHDYRVYG